MRAEILVAASLSILVTSAPAAGQLSSPARPEGGQQPAVAAQQLKEARYRVGQVERLLEGAVEHAATIIRDRLQALMPADMLLTESARARGFRLDGYGVFFDVEVPSLEGTLAWSFRTLDQNALGLDRAIRTLRSFIDRAATDDVNLQQALKRIELQVAPVTTSIAPPAAPGVQAATAGGGVPQADTPVADPILDDPDEAWRAQVREALIDTMLDHSRGLRISSTEMLTVAARGINDRPRLAPLDTESRTMVISVRGGDLSAFLAGEISREDARKRVDVRVF